jgi:hypothetical protein
MGLASLKKFPAVDGVWSVKNDGPVMTSALLKAKANRFRGGARSEAGWPEWAAAIPDANHFWTASNAKSSMPCQSRMQS